MKKSIKVLGLAVLAMLTVASCKNNANTENTDSLIDSTAIEAVVEEVDSIDTTAVVEEVPVAKPAATATKKAETKAEEPTVKSKIATQKADPRSVAGEAKVSDDQTVSSKENVLAPKSGKKDPRKAAIKK